MRNFGIFFLFLVATSTSCSDTNSFKVIDNVQFDVGFKYNAVDCYFDKGLDQEVIYFTDLGGRRDVKIFALNGKFLKSVPMANSLKLIDNIGRIKIIAADTILINSNYTNQILIIDGKGRVTKKVDLQLVDKTGNLFELTASAYPTTQYINSMLYNCSWRSNGEDITNSKVPTGNFEYLKYFFKNCYDAPYFVTISDLYSNGPKVEYHLFGFYKQISAIPEIFAEPPFFTVVGQNIFINSVYSDKIFQINRINFEVEKTITVFSKETKIGSKPININKETINKIQDSITYKGKTSGQILRLLYSSSNQEYFCIVKHATSLEKYNPDRSPFSVLVYDKNFNLKKEHILKSLQYDCRRSIMTEKGLLFQNIDTSKSLIKDGKITFSLFHFD